MKKFLLYTFASLVIVSVTTNQLSAATANPTTVLPSNSENVLQVQRLHEIETMDKSTMTFQEKKDLREESRTIKTSLRDGSGGIYISVGALIIIILLLIILL